MGNLDQQSKGSSGEGEATRPAWTALKVDSSSGSCGKFNHDICMDSSFSTPFPHTCASALHSDARACAHCRCMGTARFVIELFCAFTSLRELILQLIMLMTRVGESNYIFRCNRIVIIGESW